MSCPLDDNNDIFRIELAKKALLTMIDYLKDGNQMLISVFDNKTNFNYSIKSKKRNFIFRRKN